MSKTTAKPNEEGARATGGTPPAPLSNPARRVWAQGVLRGAGRTLICSSAIRSCGAMRVQVAWRRRQRSRSRSALGRRYLAAVLTQRCWRGTRARKAASSRFHAMIYVQCWLFNPATKQRLRFLRLRRATLLLQTLLPPLTYLLRHKRLRHTERRRRVQASWALRNRWALLVRAACQSPIVCFRLSDRLRVINHTYRRGLVELHELEWAYRVLQALRMRKHARGQSSAVVRQSGRWGKYAPNWQPKAPPPPPDRFARRGQGASLGGVHL